MSEMIQFFVWPIIGLAIVIALFVLVKALSLFYVRVPPNKAAFFYGARSGKKGLQRATQAEVPGVPGVTVLPPGTVVVTGGGRIRKPIIEDVQFLDLTEITLPQIRVENMPNTDGVLVTVEAVANIRFKDDAQSLLAAGARFLSMPHEKVQSVARETLEANLRGVVGTLTVDQLIKDRDAFRQQVLREAAEDLARLGMQIDVFNPQSITDQQGYIEALGKKRTAEVKRDAMIGEAEAQAEAKKRSTDAERAAEVVAQENERLKSEAQKNTNVAKQQYAAEISKQTAITEQAGPLATAGERQKVIVAEVKIEEERSRAQIAVEEQNILREQKAQEAEVVVPAKAKADSQVKEAEGYRQAQISRADGDKYATIARADAEKHKRSQEGLGQAEAVKATGLAEADVIERQGLARAVSVAELAKAYRQFNDAALTLEMLKILPQVIESCGAVFGAIAAPMGNIDKLVVVDAGGGEGKDGALSRFAKTGPLLLFQLVEQAKAAGIDVSALVQRLGIKLGETGEPGAAGAPAGGGATE
ncbi:MAG TPA: SPFH domain-containing protein [candidate division Zixibacteria bacterium]|nr:SPFH domain-containing protein [candidate division Zixibacteria bacterium]